MASLSWLLERYISSCLKRWINSLEMCYSEQKREVTKSAAPNQHGTSLQTCRTSAKGAVTYTAWWFGVQNTQRKSDKISKINQRITWLTVADWFLSRPRECCLTGSDFATRCQEISSLTNKKDIFSCCMANIWVQIHEFSWHRSIQIVDRTTWFSMTVCTWQWNTTYSSMHKIVLFWQ